MTGRPARARPPSKRWLAWIGGGIGIVLVLCAGIGVGSWIAIRQRYADTHDTHDLDERLATQVEAYLAQRPHGAVVVGVVQQERTAIYGFGQLPEGAVPDADTEYEIGSLSKVFTALLLADMVTRGDVATTDMLGDLRPRPANAYDAETRSAPAVSVITLGQLATHTSGLPRLPAGLSDAELASANPYAAYDLDRLWLDLDAAQLENAPGVSFQYSNFGAGVLGQILAQQAGVPFDALITERVLDPLDLGDTVLALTSDQHARLAPGFVLGANVPATNWDLNALAPAGGLKSTARDLTAFISANLHAAQGDRPIDRALVESHRVLYKGFDQSLAYGWIVQDQLWGQRAYWHNGGTGGYTSYLAIDFDHEAGIVILSNYGDTLAGNGDLDALGLAALPLISQVSLP